MPQPSRIATGRTAGRIGLIAASVVVGTAAVAVIGAAGFTALVARRIVTPPRRRDADIRILAVDRDPDEGEPERITVSATPDTVLAGRYGLWFDDDRGYARMGEVLVRDGERVTRELLSVDSGVLVPGLRGRISGWFHRHPRELGLPVEEVLVETEGGPAPAWLVPAEEGADRWVVQVHGRAAARGEAIRAVPVFRDAGYSSLIISYRNDPEAPPSPDGRYGLGDTEWRDVEAAVELAVERGATEIVLMGWSMGGATVLQAAMRMAPQRQELLRGIVLESPVVDWYTTLEFQAATLRVPRALRLGALSAISRPWGAAFTGQRAPIDLRAMDLVTRHLELVLPTLILHSDDDGFVPSTASRALAEARPDIVRLEAFDTARHVKLWNYDRERWEGALRRWLSERDAIARTAQSGRR